MIKYKSEADIVPAYYLKRKDREIHKQIIIPGVNLWITGIFLIFHFLIEMCFSILLNYKPFGMKLALYNSSSLTIVSIHISFPDLLSVFNFLSFPLALGPQSISFIYCPFDKLQEQSYKFQCVCQPPPR